MEDSVTAVPAKPAAYAPDLEKLKKLYQQACDLTLKARREAMIDLDYYHGYQWTAEERAVLHTRHQPDNVFNRVRPSVNGTIGVIMKGATDPRAFPRTPKDEDGADVASKALRFAKDETRLDDTTTEVALDYLVPGIGAAIVEVDGDRKVKVHQIRFEEFFYDPHSRRKDFKDARFMGVAKWQWVDEVSKRYPGKEQEIVHALASVAMIDDLNSDRPTDMVAWCDPKNQRILVVEMFIIDSGGWKRCVFHAAGFLEAGDSPYVDDKRLPTNPIEAESCYVDRENRRIGIVRDMRGPQDEINKRRSKLLNEASNRQLRQTQMVGDEEVADFEEIRREAARADGLIRFGWEPVQRSDVTAAQTLLLQHATAEIERMSPNPAILGREGESQSGRANLIRQQAGMTEQAIIFGGIQDWQLRVYRQMWWRMRQFWTGPMYVRITDDLGSPEFVQINEPQTDPATGQVLGYANPIAELDVDLILDTVPDTVNLQAEQFAQLAEFAKLYGPQEVPFEDMVRLSTLPNKRELLEARKARQEEAAQAQQQPDPAQELAMRAGAAEIAVKEATVTEKVASAGLKAAQAQNEMRKPETEAIDRLIAMNSRPQASA